MEAPFYQCHVFCCTNRREGKDGQPPKRVSCGLQNSEALRDYMKKRMRELGLNTEENRIRVNTAGCLDRCELGPIMVIYPEGTWYHYRSEADIDEILQSHFIDKQPVARLLVTNAMRELPGGMA